MKPGALFDRLLDLIYRPWEARATGAIMANHGVISAARIVATLAPSGAVAHYVHRVGDSDRLIGRWRFAITQGGGLIPLVFMLAAHYLTDSGGGWWTVGAQCAWILLFLCIGQPWLNVTLDLHQLDLRAAALAEMCEATNATQEQLNAASQRLGGGRWTTHNPHDDR